jgi:hypothetical protein
VEAWVGATARFSWVVLSLVMPVVSLASITPDLEVRAPKVYELDVAVTANSRAVVDVVGRLAKGEIEVVVAVDYGSFYCEVRRVKRLSPRRQRLEIAWEPGSDLSGCKLLITNVESDEKALVHLYMIY